MKVKILVEFDVTSNEDPDECGELTEAVAKGAASQAAWDYLAFVKIAGYSSSAEKASVNVDGFGKCSVAIGEDHE